VIPLIPEAETFLAISSSRFTALADVLIGFAGAYLILYSVRLSGKLFWGSQVHKSDKPAQFRWEGNTLTLEKVCSLDINAVCKQRTDRLVLEATDLRLSYTAKKSNKESTVFISSAPLVINRNKLRIHNFKLPLSQIKLITGDAQRWYTPQDVLGYGDIKLVAMIGAILGLDAVLFIIAFSSLSGFLLGSVQTLVLKNQGKAVPFAPYLTLGSYLWIFGGPELFNFLTVFML